MNSRFVSQLVLFVSWFSFASAPCLAQLQSPAVAQPANTYAPSPESSAAQKTPAKVWTNDDIDTGHNGRSDSSVPVGASTKKVSASSKTYSQEKDPAWYRKQLLPLTAEIDRLDAEIAKLKAFLSGENVSDPPTMHHQLVSSPREQLNQMETKRQADAAKVDDLLDRARHNGIEPGALR